MEKSLDNDFPIELAAPVLADTDQVESTEELSESPPFPRLAFFALAVVSALGAFVGSTYFFTRPCVLGTCDLLHNAQAREQEIQKTLQTASAKPDVLAAQSQLRQTARQLQKIPAWSQQHQTAQLLASQYQTQAEDLTAVVAAQDQAAIALQRGLNPPHSAEEWAQTQQQWQRAIAQLQQVPRSSSAYPLAQRKIAEYQKNIALTQQFLLSEQRANQILRQARAAAQLAETRQNLAKDLDGWQKAQVSWQRAMTLLRQISTKSTAATQVEELTNTYAAKLLTVRNRTTQEQVSLSSYTQATRLAQQAKAQEQKRQWSQAVATWRNALTFLQQVPADTAYAAQAQTLSATYNASLQQAQQQLQAVALLQSAQADLNKTCAGTPRICTFDVNAQVLRVQLTPAYLQTLLTQTAVARQTGDLQAQTSIQQHLTTLQNALSAVSKNANLPLEIYDPNGNLMTRYDPPRS